jgi:hypothetical protein
MDGHVQTMKINATDKPKRGGDKHPVIKVIIVPTHVQKKDGADTRYTRTHNKSATMTAPVSIQISPPPLVALSRSPVDTPSLRASNL